MRQVEGVGNSSVSKSAVLAPVALPEQAIHRAPLSRRSAQPLPGRPGRSYLRHTIFEHIDEAKKAGLDAIAMTWHRKVCTDPKAFAYASERGMLLIPGMEADVNGKHLVVLGLARRRSAGEADLGRNPRPARAQAGACSSWPLTRFIRAMPPCFCSATAPRSTPIRARRPISTRRKSGGAASSPRSTSASGRRSRISGRRCARRAPQVYVVPNFISSGYFTEQIIPRELGLTGPVTRIGDQDVFYCQPVGLHPAMTEALLRRRARSGRRLGRNDCRSGEDGLPLHLRPRHVAQRQLDQDHPRAGGDHPRAGLYADCQGVLMEQSRS
jgi:hypothetical protein